jgi:small subunit ribosomal protein S2
MSRIKELFNARVHFGHKTEFWSPQMAPFIWGKKDGIHLINVALTDIQLTKAEKLLEEIASKGQSILWVGTKAAAKESIIKYSEESASSFFANRWIGGTLTNYHEVKKKVKNLVINKEIFEKSKDPASGIRDRYTKKELAVLKKKIERSRGIVEGIEKLSYPVGALIVVDVQKDNVAVKEAQRMGIPVIGLVDTNVDPRGVTVIVPSNDDHREAIDVICSYLAKAIVRGNQTFAKNNEELLAKKKEEELLAKKEDKEDADDVETDVSDSEGDGEKTEEKKVTKEVAAKKESSAPVDSKGKAGSGGKSVKAKKASSHQKSSSKDRGKAKEKKVDQSQKKDEK